MRSIGLYAFVALYSATVLIALHSGFSFASALRLCAVIALALFCSRLAQAASRPLLLPMAVGIGIALLRVAILPSGTPAALEQLVGQTTDLTGVVIALPDVRETNEKLTVSVRIGSTHARILATVPLYPPIHAGDEVRLSGKLERPQAFDTEGGRTFAYDSFLRKDGVYALMTGRAEPIGTSKDPWLRFLRLLEAFKGALTRSLGEALPEPESALAVGILVGGKQGLGVRLIEDFTKSGMLQIIVLSGFNVMIVASALMRLLARAPKRAAFLIAGTSIMSFVLLARAGSSAVRAGLMAGFVLAARTFGRPYHVLRIICITLFLIALWNPLTLAYDPGFQFSFVATLGLVMGTPLIAPRLLFLRSRVVIELLSTTLAAEAALLPLLLYETGNLSLVSVLANAIAMPAIPFGMAASAAAAALALPLSHVSAILPPMLGLPAYVPLAYVIKVAALSSSLPFASRTVPAFPFWLVLASYAAFAALVYRLSRPLRPGTGSPQPPSSDSGRRRPRRTSSPPGDSRSYTHAPTGR